MCDQSNHKMPRFSMTQTQILNEFSKLSLSEQLEVIQAAFRISFQQVQKMPGPTSEGKDRHVGLAEAAELLLDDYLTDEELTVFAALDGEPFYAAQ